MGDDPVLVERGQSARRRETGAGCPYSRVTLLEMAVVLVWVLGVCGMDFWTYFLGFAYAGTRLALVRSFAEHRAEKTVARRTAIVEQFVDFRPAVSLQQSARRASLAGFVALVSFAGVVSAQSRRVDRAQRRPRLPDVFRRGAALSVSPARCPSTSERREASPLTGADGRPDDR